MSRERLPPNAQQEALILAMKQRSERRRELLRSRDAVIYALTDPDGTPRYVGRSVEIDRRFNDHLAGSSRKVSAWVGDLAAKGEKPGLMIICVCLATEGHIIEGHYLALWRDRYPLLNTCLVAF